MNLQVLRTLTLVAFLAGAVYSSESEHSDALWPTANMDQARVLKQLPFGHEELQATLRLETIGLTGYEQFQTTPRLEVIEPTFRQYKTVGKFQAVVGKTEAWKPIEEVGKRYSTEEVRLRYLRTQIGTLGG